MKGVIRNIIILIVLIVLGIVGYSVFFKKNIDDQGGLATTASSGTTLPVGVSDENAVGREFLGLLLNIRSLKLDDSIFTSQAFLSLQDFSRPIPPDTNPGRPNPFAPLGADGAAISTQVSTSNPSSVTSTTSVLNGTLTIGGPDVLRWFEYGTTSALGTKTTERTQSAPGVFSETISGLSPNTTYYVKAAASIGGQVVAGNAVTWRTAE